MKLHAIAHARAGDKGDLSDLTVFAFDRSDYQLLVEQVTPARVKAHFGALVSGEVERLLLPHYAAVKLLLHGALGGGVTRSLALDAHGKSYASVLLDLEVSESSKAPSHSPTA